jgi:hypothetical protein
MQACLAFYKLPLQFTSRDTTLSGPAIAKFRERALLTLCCFHR